MSLLDRNRNKIRVVIYKKNRQVIIKKVIPESNSFSHDGKSYTIDKENYYYHKKLATYSYREDVPIPLSLNELQVKKGQEFIEFENILMSSEELDTFKRSKTAKEILETIDSKSPEGLFAIITVVITIIGLGALYYVLNEQMLAIINQIQNISDALGVPADGIGQ